MTFFDFETPFPPPLTSLTPIVLSLLSFKGKKKSWEWSRLVSRFDNNKQLGVEFNS
jgi:hypothetical protein